MPRRFEFREDASCNIQPEGLISENFVQCDPGTPGKDALQGEGVPTREFRVDDYGAPPYPELVIATSADTLAERPELVTAMVEATGDGYADVLDDPERGLDAMVDEVPGLDRATQSAELVTLMGAEALGSGTGLDRRVLQAWARWDAEHGIVASPPRVEDAFALHLMAD